MWNGARTIAGTWHDPIAEAVRERMRVADLAEYGDAS